MTRSRCNDLIFLARKALMDPIPNLSHLDFNSLSLSLELPNVPNPRCYVRREQSSEQVLELP